MGGMGGGMGGMGGMGMGMGMGRQPEYISIADQLAIEMNMLEAAKRHEDTTKANLAEQCFNDCVLDFKWSYSGWRTGDVRTRVCGCVG